MALCDPIIDDELRLVYTLQYEKSRLGPDWYRFFFGLRCSLCNGGLPAASFPVPVSIYPFNLGAHNGSLHHALHHTLCFYPWLQKARSDLDSGHGLGWPIVSRSGNSHRRQSFRSNEPWSFYFRQLIFGYWSR